MQNLEAANRYARAFFKLAEEKGKTADLDASLEQAEAVFSRQPKLKEFIKNPGISETEKQRVLGEALSPAADPLLVHFIKLLIRKRRFLELKDIQNEFRRLYEKKLGIENVEVISVQKITETAEKKLTEILGKIMKAKIRLVHKPDPAILGGLILRFDGREIDSSYRTRLLEMRQQLMA